MHCKYKLFFIFLLIFSFQIRVYGVVGCQKNSDGNVYIAPPAGLNQWTNGMQENCPTGSLTSDQYASIVSYTTTPATTCYIGFFGLGGAGKLVNYSIKNCPLDDYIPFMVIAVGALGFFYMCRKNNLVSVIR